MSIEFQPWPKIARLNRTITISEKLDGSNAAVVIVQVPFGSAVEDDPNRVAVVIGLGLAEDGLPEVEYHVFAQSRTRFITPKNDNYGFAGWIERNAERLVEMLGEGTHFGEWWGAGIQRKYGFAGGDAKHFSLFNTKRWVDFDQPGNGTDLYNDDVPGLGVVPVLYEGLFSEQKVKNTLQDLMLGGSVAAPGFQNPEGIVIFHHASREMYKVTLEGDEAPKGAAGHALDNGRKAA